MASAGCRKHRSFPALLFLLLGAGTFCQAASFFEQSDVFDLNPATFKSKVLESDNSVWMIMFYAPWCGHCQRLKPDFMKAASKYQGIVKFGAINCDDHSGIAGEYGVRGFPTLKIFGVNKRKPQDYQGERSASGMGSATVAALPNLVTTVTPKSAEGFFTQTDTPKAVLFTAKSTTTSLYKGLALSFKNRMVMAEVRAGSGKASDLLDRFGITKAALPTLLVVPAGDIPRPDLPKYEGELKAKPIQKFLLEYALPKKGATSSQAKTSASAKSGGSASASASSSASSSSPGTSSSSSSSEKTASSSASASASASSTARTKKGAEVTEAKSTEDVEGCFKGPGFCVLGLLDKKAQGDGGGEVDANHVAEITRLAGKYQADPFTFMWAARSSIPSLAAAVSKEDGPSVLILHKKRQKFAVHKGLDNIDSTLDRALGGDLTYAQLPQEWKAPA